MKQITFWKALEYICRVLGISTGAVLIGVGTETWLQGQFKSLAVYLLISGIAVSLCEGAYFASLLLAICFIPKQDSMMHSFWKQARRRGAFQKFLACALLSVACFLHPVLVWHVTIPGTMLVITGFANFLLSKQHKEATINGQQSQYVDPPCTAEATVGEEDTGQIGPFLKKTSRGQHHSLIGQLRKFFKNCKKQEAATGSARMLSPTRQVLFREKEVNIVLSVKENSEEQENLTEDTTSDTAPILSLQL